MTDTDARPSPAMLTCGTIIFAVSLGAWLYAAINHIDATGILSFAVPVIGALFLVTPVSTAARAAASAASQTNGVLDQRVKSAVASALAERDHTRSWQASRSADQPTLPTDTPL